MNAQTMRNALTPGGTFRLALRDERPLQIMGTVNAYAAMMAARVGYKAHEEQIDQLYKP